ncbi:MAG: hypothetical protein K2L11_11740 [Muribaculaceae bacterium]|nr:hypothetical protein [Muribaculaceae bacterium]
MTVFNDNPDIWPTLLLLVLLAIAVFGAMMATNRADRLKDESIDLARRLEAQEEITRQRDQQLLLAETDAANLRNDLRQANDSIATVRKENVCLRLQLQATFKDLESIRAFNGDMHRVIDMDAQKLKEKDRIISEQKDKIDRLMKIRRK